MLVDASNAPRHISWKHRLLQGPPPSTLPALLERMQGEEAMQAESAQVTSTLHAAEQLSTLVKRAREALNAAAAKRIGVWWRRRKNAKKLRDDLRHRRDDLFSAIATGNVEYLDKSTDLVYLAGPRQSISNMKTFHSQLKEGNTLSSIMERLMEKVLSGIASAETAEETQLRKTADQAEQVQKR